MKTFLWLAAFMCCGILAGKEGLVKISAAYPGGNVKVLRIEPGKAEITSDLRDTDRHWFYWNFEAVAEEPGRVKFVFPAGNSYLSAQGPAVSTDGGKSWRWMDADSVHFRKQAAADSFTVHFSRKGETIRFAQGFPYLKKDLELFLEKYKGSPHLTIRTLTATRKGQPVPLLVIGQERPAAKHVLFTARHHACEAIASYALEGILEEVLSDSPAAKKIRNACVLYVVPFMDLDGVEAGDQGKGRAPHDHNRDYGLKKHLYPEVAAIEALDREKSFDVAVDFHAPAVRGDIHEALYWGGGKTPENKAYAGELTAWIAEDAPFFASRVLNLMGPGWQATAEKGTAFSYYFAGRPHIAFGTTLEIPYATRHPEYDGAMVKEFGKAFLRALARMDMERSAEPRTAHAEFQRMKKSLHIGSPGNRKMNAEKILHDPAAAPLWKMEAALAMAFVSLSGKNFQTALEFCDSVLASPEATARQKEAAAVRKTAVLCKMPETTEQILEDWISRINHMNLTGTPRYTVFDSLYGWAKEKNQIEKCRIWAEEQLACAPEYFVGRIRNRIARAMLDKGGKAQAAEYSRITAQALRDRLIPKMPVGVFGATQAEDLVNALLMIPETQEKDLIDAIDLGLNHKHCPIATRQYLSGLKQKIQENGKN